MLKKSENSNVFFCCMNSSSIGVNVRFCPSLFQSILKDTLWVLSRDESLVHVSIDISLITKDIFNHVISLES